MQSGDQCTELLFVCNCCDPLPVHVLSFDSLCYGLRLKYYNVKDFFHECKFPLAELEEQRYPGQSNRFVLAWENSVSFTPWLPHDDHEKQGDGPSPSMTFPHYSALPPSNVPKHCWSSGFFSFIYSLSIDCALIVFGQIRDHVNPSAKGMIRPMRFVADLCE
jgi:hypothetical protein